MQLSDLWHAAAENGLMDSIVPNLCLCLPRARIMVRGMPFSLQWASCMASGWLLLAGTPFCCAASGALQGVGPQDQGPGSDGADPG